MASLVPNLRKTLFSARSIAGQLGFRPYSVDVVVGDWAGPYVGRGGGWEKSYPIQEGSAQSPKVRFLNEERRALGQLNAGSCEIGPITPDFLGGGTPLDRLAPAIAAKQTVHVELTGPAYPDGALFLIKELRTDRVLRWMLVCEPVE